MKDQANKKAHDESAQVACEAASAIRTVASLTREEDCCLEYHKSLEIPMSHSNRVSLYSSALYALTQATWFFAVALVCDPHYCVSRQTWPSYVALIGLLLWLFAGI